MEKLQADYKSFEAQSRELHFYTRTMQALGTLRAAKNDYEQGYLFNTRILVEAEVFDDFLEQGEHLLDSGYYQPAAVVIGSVLEDGFTKAVRKTRNTVICKAQTGYYEY